VFQPLYFNTIDASLLDFAVDAFLPIVRLGISPELLSMDQIATGLFGRGSVDPGGPSEFEILEPLMDTDTKSYDDFVGIFSHLNRNESASNVVSVFVGDGQSVIQAKNNKVRWPRLYAKWLLMAGGFHEHAHFMFACTELYCPPFVRYCLDELDIQRVETITHNLEHNAYAHHQHAHHVIVIASVCYLLQDVQQPPPRLLLRNLDAYLAQVETAGGVVMVRYLRHAGLPILQWQRASRDGRGQKLKLLFAYAFLLFRTVHKPICAQVVLIAMLGFCCTLPALQAVLLSVTSLSLLGHLSSNMYLDRMLELINKLQQGAKRSCNAQAFGRAIDMTSLLRTILHVRHAFQAHEHGAAETDDPITPSMLIQARLLQDEFLRELGRDLTVQRNDNPFHHTRNPVPLDGGTAGERRPWELVERVDSGRSAGVWRGRAERGRAYIRRFVFEHFFPY
jgi:hypothetical protein